jgi:hypothetical protein
VFSLVMSQYPQYRLDDLLDMALPQLLYLFEWAAFYRQEDQVGAFAGALMMGSGAYGNQAKGPGSGTGIMNR